jgi:hypothetical protein
MTQRRLSRAVPAERGGKLVTFPPAVNCAAEEDCSGRKGRLIICGIMSWSISEALTDPVIREPITFRSEFKFFLKNIPTEITVRFYNPVASSKVLVRQSHFISVPGLDPQAAAECESDSEDGEMLRQVISVFTCTYNAAIQRGIQPDVSWLKPNPDFS